MDSTYIYKHRFSLDFETRSGQDIKTVGMHKYVADRDFKILMMSYAMDDEPVQLFECYDRQLPKWFTNEILRDPHVLKTAYNAPFEIHSLEAELGIRIDRRQWQCTRIMAGMAGYPMNLKDTAKAMKLETLKDARGTQLINLFTQPAKPRDMRRNGGHYWNYPEFYPQQWEEFKEYCIQDTVVERAILNHKTVADMPQMPEYERRLWLLDQKINDRGIMMDMPLIHKILDIHGMHVEQLLREGTKLTGLPNINSPKQLLEWLESEGCVIDNLRKDTVMETLGHPKLSGRVKRILEIRSEISKTSLKKFDAMVGACGQGDRARGMFQHYAANRTGRWGGRVVQLQNLPKNYLKKKRLTLARYFASEGMPKALKMIFGRLPFVLAELVRTAFIPTPGKKFIVSDFNAIESRVSAWIAGAEWKLQAFREGKDIYLVNASAMYGIPYEQLTKESPEREPAKVGELSFGFGGGENAAIGGGALKSGKLTEDDLPVVLKAWRKINPEIKEAWAKIDELAKEAIRDPGLITTFNGKVRFMMQHGNLLIKLPSGRTLSYVNTRIETYVSNNPFYDPEELHRWIEEKRGLVIPEKYKLPEDLDILRKDDKDWAVSRLREWVEEQSGKEIPYFIVRKFTEQRFEREAILYEGMEQRGNGQRVWGTASTWGGKIFQNCCTFDTFVLTDLKGWIHIVDVTPEMRVWDGLKWVYHGGVVAQGVRDTIRLDGVGITPDHKVLTNKGWKNAEETNGTYRAKKDHGYLRYEVEFSDRDQVRGFRREKINVANPVRLRKRNRYAGRRVQKGKVQIMWVHEKPANWKGKHETWTESSSAVRRLGLDARQVHKSKLSGISQLRRAGYYRLRQMEKRFSKFLGRYDRYLRTGFVVGSHRHKWELRKIELQMDKRGMASPKYPSECSDKYSLGSHDRCRSCYPIRPETRNNLYTDKKSLARRRFATSAGRKEEVYDLLNCGDLHRFMVKSKDGYPFIIHNCVQSTARDCVAHALLSLDEEGIDTVAHVHDETVNEAPLSMTVQEVNNIMETPIPWAPDLPLKAAGFESLFYMKD